MASKRTLKRWFQDPVKHANDLIQDQLERMEVQFNHHVKTENHANALAVYQEYAEWIDAEEGEKYGFLLIDQIATY